MAVHALLFYLVKVDDTDIVMAEEQPAEVESDLYALRRLTYNAEKRSCTDSCQDTECKQ